MSSKTFECDTLFRSLLRRIPPSSSENYHRYCAESGVDPAETDPLVLLGTIGHRGASSFIFEIDDSLARQEAVLAFYSGMVSKLSYDTVALAFGVDKTGLFKLLKGESSATKSGIYDLLELCYLVPQAKAWKVLHAFELPDFLKKQVIEH